MTGKKKDWFDTHVIVKTLNDDKDAEKKLKKEIKKIYEGKKWKNGNVFFALELVQDLEIMQNLSQRGNVAISVMM